MIQMTLIFTAGILAGITLMVIALYSWALTAKSQLTGKHFNDSPSTGPRPGAHPNIAPVARDPAHDTHRRNIAVAGPA